MANISGNTYSIHVKQTGAKFHIFSVSTHELTSNYFLKAASKSCDITSKRMMSVYSEIMKGLCQNFTI